MIRLIRGIGYKARVLVSAYYAYMLQYRAELLLWALSGSLPFIAMGVWMKAAEGGAFGLSPLELARYFFSVFLVRQLTIVFVIFHVEEDIVHGRLSSRLLQPLDPIFRHLAEHVAERGARLPLLFGLVCFFFILYPRAFWLPSVSRVLWFGLAIFSVFVLRFMIQYTLALASFWMERATALEELWFVIYLFLSGMIAPISLYPDRVAEVIRLTPFPYLIDFPARVLVGEPVSFSQSFGMIFLWTLVFTALNRVLWVRGLKRYSGMGA